MNEMDMVHDSTYFSSSSTKHFHVFEALLKSAVIDYIHKSADIVVIQIADNELSELPNI
jgi:hypothetical protein